MNWKAICILGVSAVLVSAGIAVRSSLSMGATANVLLALGVGIAACVGALHLAHALIFLRTRHLADDNVQRLHVFARELVAVAELVERKGLLALAEARVSIASDLFARGAQCVIAGIEPARLRTEVQSLATAYSAEARSSLDRWAGLAQWGSIALLTLAAVSMAALAFSPSGLFAAATSPALDVAGLIALFCVYTGFLLAVISQQTAKNLGSRIRETELSGVMIAETLQHLRAGVSPGVIHAHLQRLITPGTEAKQATQTRAAA